MRSILLGAWILWACGCAPPDPVAGGIKSITFVSPTPDQIEFPIGADGTIHVFVAVDVDGFTFREIGDGEAGNESEGHWHLYINNAYDSAQNFQATELILEAEPDDQFSLRGELATDDHQTIFDDGVPIDDVVEFTAVAGGTR